MGEAAAVTSLASLGLSAYSSIQKGKATQSANEMKAAQAEQSAEFGRLQAEQTDTTKREQLVNTLGNIEAIRAASHTDATSPTTIAIEDYQSQVSERQRLSATVSERSQAESDESSAFYLRSAGSFALTQGEIGAGISVLGGLSKSFGTGGTD